MRNSTITSALSISAFAAIALLSTTPALAAWAHTYISFLGSDNNDCSVPAGSVAGPCASFARALAQTLPGGSITLLGPGFLNLGRQITIDKSIHITSEPGTEAYLSGNDAGNVVTIDAGVGDIVHLRGVTVSGQGTAAVGILIRQASAVHIQNCVIRDFEAANSFGIAYLPDRNSQLFVSDTIIFNNGSSSLTGGILIEPQAGSRADVVLDRVHLENNVDGLLIDGAATSGPGSHVIVRDSVMSGNAANGIHAFTRPGMSSAFVLVERSSMVNNGQSGILADGPGATVLLSESSITRNGTGVSTVNSGQLFSYGNNRNNNNLGAEGSATGFLSAF